MPRTTKTIVNLPHGYKVEISEPQIKILRVVERESRDKASTYEGEDVVGHHANSPRGAELAVTNIINDYSSRMGKVSIEELQESLGQFAKAITEPCAEIVAAIRSHHDNAA